MWLVAARAPLPDAPYWPGRRLFAFFDAMVWPAAWIALVTQLPQVTGIVGPMVIALAALSAAFRTRRALWENQRYRFTTLRWARYALALVVIGTAIKLLPQ